MTTLSVITLQVILWKLLMHPAVESAIGESSAALTVVVNSTPADAVDSMIGVSGGKVALLAELHIGAHASTYCSPHCKNLHKSKDIVRHCDSKSVTEASFNIPLWSGK